MHGQEQENSEGSGIGEHDGDAAYARDWRFVHLADVIRLVNTAPSECAFPEHRRQQECQAEGASRQEDCRDHGSALLIYSVANWLRFAYPNLICDGEGIHTP